MPSLARTFRKGGHRFCRAATVAVLRWLAAARLGFDALLPVTDEANRARELGGERR